MKKSKFPLILKTQKIFVPPQLCFWGWAKRGICPPGFFLGLFLNAKDKWAPFLGKKKIFGFQTNFLIWGFP